MNSTRRASQLERALGGRRVVVSGVRGTDSLSIADSPFFAGSHALTMHDCHDESPSAYEDLVLSRPGLARFQFQGGPAEGRWVRGLRDHVSDGVVVVPYKAFAFHKRLGLGSHSWFLGLEPEVQNRFDERDWIEAGLADADVDTIPWRTPLHRLALEEAGTPLVVRRNRSVGGSGFRLIDDEHALAAVLNRDAAIELAYAPFYSDASHLSTLAVADGEGQISLHGISRQLVGLPSLTASAFEHCGNRFGAAAAITPDIASEVDRRTRKVGRWMATRGYVGTYGADWLLWGGNLWLAEVNARFTGAVLGNDMVAAQLGQTSVYFNHIAAFLGIPRAVEVECRDFLAAPGITVVHAVSHERTPVALTSPQEIEGWDQVGRPRDGVSVEHGGTLAMLVSSSPPGGSGASDDELASLVAEVRTHFTAASRPS